MRVYKQELELVVEVTYELMQLGIATRGDGVAHFLAVSMLELLDREVAVSYTLDK